MRLVGPTNKQLPDVSSGSVNESRLWRPAGRRAALGIPWRTLTVAPSVGCLQPYVIEQTIGVGSEAFAPSEGGD